MAVFSNVQSGTATLATGATSTTATITSVDTSKSFVVATMGPTTPSPDVNQFTVNAELTNSTTLTFEGNTTGDAREIRWYVVEFSSGVSVQRSTTVAADFTDTGAQYVANVTISAVDLSKTFVLQNGAFAGTNFNSDDLIRNELTSTTNLQFSCDDRASPNATPGIKWQVVEYTGCTVTAGAVAFSTTDLSKTSTVSIGDTSAAWLMHSYRHADPGSATTGADYQSIIGVVTNSTTLTFSRADDIGVGIDLYYYLVEFTDGTVVRSGTASFGTAATDVSPSISAVTAANSVVQLAGFNNSTGKIDYNATNTWNSTFARATALSSTSLTLTRDTTDSLANDAAYYVIDFSGAVATGVIKTFNGLARASVKTVEGLALASVKTKLGTSNV